MTLTHNSIWLSSLCHCGKASWFIYGSTNSKWLMKLDVSLKERSRVITLWFWKCKSQKETLTDFSKWILILSQLCSVCFHFHGLLVVFMCSFLLISCHPPVSMDFNHHHSHRCLSFSSSPYVFKFTHLHSVFVRSRVC